MTLIVCVDDKLGMAFNKRRQSRDGEGEKIRICHGVGLSNGTAHRPCPTR